MQLYFALFRLAFASAPWQNHLTSLHIVTRRPILQKVQDQTIASWQVVLSLLVSIQFQVLFHSPPGVLFTVPSRYYSLSVTRSYLALWDGPHIFTPDFSCPVLLWCLSRRFQFRLRDYYPVSFNFPEVFTYRLLSFMKGPKPQRYFYLWFGLMQFRSPLLPQSFFYFLFLRLLRCFSSAGSPHYTMYLCNDNTVLTVLCFHIRTSAGHRLSAPLRSLSQLITSFIGA